MLENIREPQERNYTTEREMLRQAGAVQREIDGVLQWTDGFFPKEMLVEGVVVAPVFGKAWAQWVYPVPLLDEAMERVSTNGGL